MGQGQDREEKKAVRNGTESVETSGDSTCWNRSLAYPEPALADPFLYASGVPNNGSSPRIELD